MKNAPKFTDLEKIPAGRAILPPSPPLTAPPNYNLLPSFSCSRASSPSNPPQAGSHFLFANIPIVKFLAVGVPLRWARVIPVLAIGWLLAGCQDDHGKESAAAEEPQPPTSIEAIAAERAELDTTVFADEVEAQRHEQTFVTLWDDLRLGGAFDVLRRFPFEKLTLGKAKPAPSPDWGLPGIQIARMEPEGAEALDREAFAKMLASLESAGWKIAQTEWHHSKFEPASEGTPARSTVSFEIHANFRSGDQRVIVRGDLLVRWSGLDDDHGKPLPAEITTSGVQLIARKGKPMFGPRLLVDPKESARGSFPRTSPILVRDLDGDGLAEIITAGCNLIHLNRGGFQFEPRPFLDHPITRPAEAGILADFTGDTIPDYIGGNSVNGSLLLFVGTADGTFPDPPILCSSTKFPLLHTLSAGDIDGDGDLDLFAGQWKAPYEGGTMPTPFYDANDGLADSLLRNDGGGKFIDITEQAGLAKKRHRRTFSATLIDLDSDDDLDLVVTADFAGLDLYTNNGDGTFTDATDTKLKQRLGFGMSHTFDDWDGDGKLDLYMVGMSSTTARRLDHLGAARDSHPEYTKNRAPMAFGNRLLLGRGDQFEQPEYAYMAARTGWSWGCTSADFDLDGDSDLYISNGHLSGDSSKDYCSQFWCHDLYTGNSKPNLVLDQFFNTQLGTKLGREFSWNGFEHNVLYLNHPGKGFLNASFLLGAAFEFDSRAVASEDLDADGLPDLLVAEYRTSERYQRLHVLENRHETANHWIGIRLEPTAGGEMIQGAIIRVKSGGRHWIQAVTSGDSFTTQHSPTAHFGLGKTEKIDEILVRWPSGQESIVKIPTIDQYHKISAPPRRNS